MMPTTRSPTFSDRPHRMARRVERWTELVKGCWYTVGTTSPGGWVSANAGRESIDFDFHVTAERCRRSQLSSLASQVIHRTVVRWGNGARGHRRR